MIESKIIQGDCLSVLKTMESSTVNCCVTSPPYYGLRDYGTGIWIGGDKDCKHRRESKKSEYTITGHKNFDDMLGVGDAIYKSVCPLCGAVRIDNQVGLEETPEQYVEKLVLIFREVKRTLRDDGTLWLNIGDSYCGTGSKGNYKDPKYTEGRNGQSISLTQKIKGLKSKDMIGIPWRVAFALQSDGWYLRQDIIWAKPNPMPESVSDRCTKSHEYIFLLSKSSQYYFNSESIKEKASPDTSVRDRDNTKLNNCPGRTKMGGLKVNDYEFRNKRSVWTIATQPCKESHFATFPKELIRPCIKAGCPVDGIVIDPFLGSGTTACVCIEENRKYLGIELNPEYIKIAQKRINSTERNGLLVFKEDTE